MTSITLTPKASATVRRYQILLNDAPGEKAGNYLHALGATVLNDLALQDARAGKCRNLSPRGKKCAAIERGTICPYRLDEAVVCAYKHDLPADMQEYRRVMHAAKARKGDQRFENLAESVTGEGRP